VAVAIAVPIAIAAAAVARTLSAAVTVVRSGLGLAVSIAGTGSAESVAAGMRCTGAVAVAVTAEPGARRLWGALPGQHGACSISCHLVLTPNIPNLTG